MDKAVILGTYEFVGYHFCTKLLENGVEVIGIHTPNLQNDDYLTNKRLTIGRNANFQEVNMEHWLPIAQITEQTLVIIDYYDYYMQRQSGFFNNHGLIEDFFHRNIQQMKETESSIIMLLPIQWATSAEEGHQLLPIKQSHRIYLPTIYGPWQPNLFLFQQALLKQLQKAVQLSLNEREWTEDAIYIDDAVHASLKLLNNPPGSFLLKSEMKDHWQKCVEALSISLNELSFHERSGNVNLKDIQVKFVDNKRLVSDGIEEQKRHIIFSLKG